MSKHTPGPWRVFKEGKFYGVDAYDIGVTIICYGEDDAGDEAGIRGANKIEAVANAHLIAAAPEMLEALKYAGQFIQAKMRKKDDEEWALYSRVIAAIARAECRS